MRKQKIIINTIIILILLAGTITIYSICKKDKAEDKKVIKIYEPEPCLVEGDSCITNTYEGREKQSRTEQNYICDYTCDNNDCDVLKSYVSGDYLIIYDGGVIVYNYVTKEKYETKLEDEKLDESIDSYSISIIDVSNKDFIIELRRNSDNTLYGYYVTKNHKIILKDLDSKYTNLYYLKDSFLALYDNEKADIIDFDGKVVKTINAASTVYGEATDKCYVINDYSAGYVKILDNKTFKEIKKFNNSSYFKIIDDLIFITGKDFIALDSNFKVIKELKNITTIEKVINNNEIYYTTSNYDIGGDINSYNMILDKDFNIIIDETKIDAKLDRNLFNHFYAYFNDNSTITVWVDNLFIYDMTGKLIKTIKDDNIYGVTNNYYFVNEDGTLALYDLMGKKVSELFAIDNAKIYEIQFNYQKDMMYITIEGNSSIKTYKYDINNKTTKLMLEN